MLAGTLWSSPTSAQVRRAVVAVHPDSVPSEELHAVTEPWPDLIYCPMLNGGKFPQGMEVLCPQLTNAWTLQNWRLAMVRHTRLRSPNVDLQYPAYNDLLGTKVLDNGYGSPGFLNVSWCPSFIVVISPESRT